jgi:putative transposase
MKKHSRQEILLKLVQADELAQAGNSQTDICKALGVSVMTLHRWRKLPLRKEDQHAPSDIAEESMIYSTNPPIMADMRRVLEELTLENRRLRKIVTDLLLEKIRIEETGRAPRADEPVDSKRKT